MDNANIANVLEYFNTHNCYDCEYHAECAKECNTRHIDYWVQKRMYEIMINNDDCFQKVTNETNS